MRARFRTSPRNAIFHIAALGLCVWVLSRGIYTTRNLEWPGDPDHLRDIGHAQTIQDGSFLADPSYLGERFWYNPLVPGLLAGLSSWLGVPIPVLHARGGAYLNLAAPIAFYAMGVSLLGAPTGLGALCAFLLLSREPSWLTATYSPWLFTANFVQAFFYAGVLVYQRAYQRRNWTTHVLTGAVLGITLLGHTAPAVLLAAIIVIATIHRVIREPHQRYRPAAHIVVVIGVAAFVAAPLLLSIVGHYRLQVKNSIPLSWLDESLQLDRWRAFLAANLGRPLLNSFAVVGVTRLVMVPPRRRGTRVIIAAWLFAAVSLLVWSAYGSQVSSTWFPQILPAHHFLVYLRASEALLFGHGLWVCASVAAALVPRLQDRRAEPSPRPRLARLLAVLAVAILVMWGSAHYDERFDFWAIRPRALQTYRDLESQQVFAWIRGHSEPSAVFLTSENSGLSMITAAGRKAVAVPRFFSNPYVEYERRDHARRQMWEFLDAGNCPAFHGYARVYRVSHVLAIQGSTAVPPPGRCGLEPAFATGRFAIFRVP